MSRGSNICIRRTFKILGAISSLRVQRKLFLDYADAREDRASRLPSHPRQAGLLVAVEVVAARQSSKLRAPLILDRAENVSASPLRHLFYRTESRSSGVF